MTHPNAVQAPHWQDIPGGAALVDRLLAGIEKRQRIPLHQMGLDAARKAYADACIQLDVGAVDGVLTQVHSIFSPDALHLRLSQPLDAEVKDVLVWVHGGGFCVGDAASTDALCRWFSVQLQCAVVAVDYRLAPEHSVPQALDDVVAAIAWAAREFPGARVSVLGDSAGAALALPAVAQCVDEARVCVSRLVLCYPLVMPGGMTASRKRYAKGHYLTMADVEWMHGLARLDEHGPLLQPLQRFHWPKGMPPALVVLPQRDPLFDEGLALARHLRQTGCSVSELHMPDFIHGCLHMGGMFPEVRTMHAHIADFIR
jgi:acetyl esterase